MTKTPALAEIYLSSLIETNCEGLHFYWCDKDNRILLCNANQARLLGFNDYREILGKTIEEISLAVQGEADAITEVYKNNQAVIASKKTITFEECFKDRWYLSYKAPFFDAQGEVQGILGISTDITERKLLEIELTSKQRATDIYLESILLSSPSNIFWMNQEGYLVGCNDQQAKYCGLTSRFELIGKNIFDVGAMLGWPPEVAKKIHERDRWIMEHRQSTTEEETVILDGEEHIFLTAKSPMYDENNNVIGVLGISVNITEQKRIEKNLEWAKQKAEASNRAKSEFVAQISHDIRTPLIGIQGITQSLAEQAPRKLQPELHALVHASSELLNLLNNVIYLTKTEMGEKSTLTQEPFDLYELIHNLIHLFIPVAQQKCLSLQVDYPEFIPRWFISTASLVQRALLNLISNALKFTPQGQVTIKVRQDNPQSLNQRNAFPLLISVEDSGIGIAADQLLEIFTQFYRVEPSYQSPYSGSGLGLSIAEKFIHQLGGKLWATSEIGKGSQFFISLCLPISHVPEFC